MLENQEIVAAIVGGIGAIAAAIVAGLRMFFKKLETYLLELKPNSGKSLKDQINRLESQHEKLSNRIDDIWKHLSEG